LKGQSSQSAQGHFDFGHTCDKKELDVTGRGAHELVTEAWEPKKWLKGVSPETAPVTIQAKVPEVPKGTLTLAIPVTKKNWMSQAGALTNSRPSLSGESSQSAQGHFDFGQ
jgi:hypothetical protein